LFPTPLCVAGPIHTRLEIPPQKHRTCLLSRTESLCGSLKSKSGHGDRRLEGRRAGSSFCPVPGAGGGGTANQRNVLFYQRKVLFFQKAGFFFSGLVVGGRAGWKALVRFRAGPTSHLSGGLLVPDENPQRACAGRAKNGKRLLPPPPPLVLVLLPVLRQRPPPPVLRRFVGGRGDFCGAERARGVGRTTPRQFSGSLAYAKSLNLILPLLVRCAHVCHARIFIFQSRVLSMLFLSGIGQSAVALEPPPRRP